MLATQFTPAPVSGDVARAGQRRAPRICLLGATFGTSNMGVSALTASAIKCVLNPFPSAEIFLLDYGREATVYRATIEGNEIEVPLANMRFSKRIFLKNHIVVLLLLALFERIIPWRAFKEYVETRSPHLRRIQEADVVAAVSGGDSFSDIYGLSRFFYVALPQILVLLMRKKLILLPQTLGPFRSSLARRVASFILLRTNMIYSRDYAGLDLLKALLGRDQVREKARFCYDLGFVLDSTSPPKTDSLDLLQKYKGKYCVVGLNVSGLLYAGGYTGNNMFGLRTDYKALVHELIDLLVRKHQAVVALVPHVFGSAEHIESDAAACQELFRELSTQYGDHLLLVEGNYNQSETKYLIGLCDLFIGARMHACIGALSQAVPAVGLAYSDKFLGVMQSLELESLVADLRKLQVNEVFAVVDRAYCRRESIRRALGQKMPEVRSRVLNLFRDLEISSCSSES